MHPCIACIQLYYLSLHIPRWDISPRTLNAREPRKKCFFILMLKCYFSIVSVNNLTAPSGLCAAGYYCNSGAIHDHPTMLNSDQCPNGTVHPIIGDLCPIGHYCPEGTVQPIGCPPGSYQDIPNQDHCKVSNLDFNHWSCMKKVCSEHSTLVFTFLKNPKYTNIVILFSYIKCVFFKILLVIGLIRCMYQGQVFVSFKNWI